jgi:hypothetical protein
MSSEEYNDKRDEAVDFVRDEFRKALRIVKQKIRKKYHIRQEDVRPVITNGFEAFVEVTKIDRGLFE